MKGILSATVVAGMAGCGAEEEPFYSTEPDRNIGYGEDGMVIPPVPDDAACEEWEFDLDDGVWECDDIDSSYYGHYFYAGKYYKSVSSLKKSSSYKGSSSTTSNSSINKSNSSSNSTVRSSSGSSSSTVKGSSGFGSGTKGGFGG